ncbi:MAG: 2-keto-4-pentenoate hydratase [Candidatus Dormibacteria bacterium]
MNDTERSALADAFEVAYSTMVPLEAPSSVHESFTVEDAYQVQRLQIDRWLKQGRRVKGHKVGLTSAAMQRTLGIDRPDYGILLNTMFWSENAPVPTRAFFQPRVEPEIAFVLGRRLEGPGVTVAEAIRAVDFVLPALELIDSRIRDWQITLPDTIADNASSGGLVLGSCPRRLDAFDLRLLGCNLLLNGELVASGAGGAVLGSPVVALTWLANALGARGVALEDGHVVLSGSCTAAVPVVAGDVVTAAFGGLGSVTTFFVGGGE